MLPRRALGSSLLVLGLLASASAGGQPDDKQADRRFDSLLAAAKKAPEKADWKALRHAFAETSRYQPYNIEWREELSKVTENLEGGDLKKAEAALTKLLDREGYMRIDAHGLAIALYDKSGEKAKADLRRKFMDGIAGTLFVPGTGTSFEKPIEVLFIEEEYFFLGVLELKAQRQGLMMHDGHRFDVYKTEPKDGGEPKEFYFNVDLPQKALGRMLGGAGEASKRN
jgi:hypothetical protein